MGTLYQILGLPQAATEEQVKAAFRALARRFHPDVNRDPTTQEHFKEVSQAYQTLSDPIARSEYDRALVCRREADRRRFGSLAATATTTFALTVGILSLVMLRGQSAAVPHTAQTQAPAAESRLEPRQQAHQKTAAAVLPEHEASTVEPKEAPRRGWSWTTYRNAPFKFLVKYPADVFALSAEPATKNGVTFISEDGEATLRIFAAKNITGTTLTGYRHSLVKNRYAGVTVDHAPRSRFWFVLSGAQGDKVIYEHVAFSCDGRSMHGWQMTYPSSERTFFDLVADEVHRNTGPITPCPAARQTSRRRTSLR